MNRAIVSVYPVIDLERAGPHPAALVAAAARGGATVVQLRDKRDRASALWELAQAARPALDAAHVPLIINDRLDLALGLGAAGVHLGQHDMPVGRARALANAAGRADLLIGVSVTTVAEAGAALAAGADYLSISPLFGTATKPDIARPAGLAGLQAVRAAHPMAAIVVIGGIRAAQVAQVVAAGADGVAFISAMGDADQAEASVRRIATAVAEARRAAPGTSPTRPGPRHP